MDPVEERKKRIEALKKKKASLVNKETVGKDAEPSSKIRFRNYIPRDDALKENTALKTEKPNTLSYEEDLREAEKVPGKNEEINIAPKKPDWDLKRGIEHKMEVLEKKTQKAMLQLLKEKIEAEESEEAEESSSKDDN